MADFQNSLTATEDWLYDEGEDAAMEVYQSKLSELKKYGEPVMERFREYQQRNAAFDDFDRAIVVYFAIIMD